MKKLLIIAALSLMAIGCKGPAGKNGAQGPSGPEGKAGVPGGGQFVFLSGNVISDDFVVSDPRISLANQISVYVGDGTNASSLNVYLPALGINAYYMFRPGQVEIVNASKMNATRYTIEIVIP